ncbi:hypothetical protein [Streptomyces hydrogenans]|uniref:hypothetical protein n=1 Tax=Streptomyces hydrogenans TaxID=1873719 RepID=UPI0036EBCCCD
MLEKITADTVGAARQIIQRAAADLDGALRDRHPGGAEALSRPLCMTIHLVLADLEAEGPVSASQWAEPGYTRLEANTAGEAQTILTDALERIAEETAHRPVHRRHRKAQDARPLRAVIHYNLADLDRDGPLYVEERLYLPYDGIPPGLQPANCHPEYELRDRQAPPIGRRPQRRSLLRRLGFVAD